MSAAFSLVTGTLPAVWTDAEKFQLVSHARKAIGRSDAVLNGVRKTFLNFHNH